MDDERTEVSPARDALPARLSPSRAKDFVQCPKLFYFKTICKLPTPPTLATAKGNLAHHALEHLFDHPRDERTVEVAVSYVEPAWASMTEPLVARASGDVSRQEQAIRDANELWREEVDEGSAREEQLLVDAAALRELAPRGSEVEAQLLAETTSVLGGYFAIERPWNFDPVGRELHLEASTGSVTLHGFIDRLDSYTTSAGEERWVISDYKTGKVPRDRYLDEAFFAMKIYALLLAESEGIVADKLRLVYLAAGDRTTGVKELAVDEALLVRTRRNAESIWASILDAADEDRWEPRVGPLCNWCHFQDICPAQRSR